ncbi:MAG: nucleoside recognition domain-containing protein [Oscillospiraceae bacterium]
MKKKLAEALPLLAAFAVFAALLLRPQEAANGARAGLSLCVRTLVPALFPFLVVSNLLLRLGAPQKLGKFFAPLMRRLFGVGGAGSAAFLLGVSGGYPLGAAAVTELCKSGAIEKKEAGRLLGFCDNSGPAFIVSAVGVAAFGSVKAGLFLYLVHVLAAALTGISQRRGAQPGGEAADFSPLSFPLAFTQSVRASADTMVTICAFVLFFSVLVGILDSFGWLFLLSGGISLHFGEELHFARALLLGLLELGNGALALQGLACTAKNLALAAFLLGWGGLSVHAQAAAVILQGGLSPARHSLGKLAHGLWSALLAMLLYPLFF